MDLVKRNGGSAVRLIAAVAGVYFHFLIFTEFALLDLIGPERSLVVMGFLAAGGIAGSLGAAWMASRVGPLERMLAWAMAGGTVLACSAPAWSAGGYAPIAAFLEGVFLGGGTVLLALCLHRHLPPGRLGMVTGCGTGLAYGLANLPLVFGAGGSIQALLGGIASAVAAIAAFGMGAPGLPPEPKAPEAGSGDASPHLYGPGLWAGIVIFGALVWADSAVFYVIQHEPALKANTWEGTGALYGNAAAHLAAAVLSGLLLDRGKVRPVLIGALLMLSLGGMLADLGQAWSPYARVGYTGGVSLYSVALVWQASRRGRPWDAALLFAVSGWLGSAMGIGMAKDLEHVPLVFFAIAGAAVLLGLMGSKLSARFVFVLPAVALLGAVWAARPADSGPGTSVDRGKQVYRSEGCMQCHSQYVRPGVGTDELLYGPGRTVEDQVAGDPPLIGNRRIGPDLSNLAARRSRAWNRLHLENPQGLVPGSRMPRYAALFHDGGTRGDDLLDYLQTLGAGSFEARAALASGWEPSGSVKEPAGADSGRRLWAAHCSQCHGETGRGDGTLARRIEYPPPDFATGEWRRLHDLQSAEEGPDAPWAREVAVMRVIKFGFPGSPMPGHEWFDDDTLRTLARHVLELHKGSKSR